MRIAWRNGMRGAGGYARRHTGGTKSENERETDGVGGERERRMVCETGRCEEGRETERGMQTERETARCRCERKLRLPHFHAETRLTCFTSGSSVCSMLRVLISRVAGSTGSGVAMIRTQLRAP